MNSNKILFTTTSNIQGWDIKKYFGIVSYQLVIGANIFRDVFASFRDVFGGISKGYQKDLENMKKIAFENIQKQAKQKGANAVVGLKIDFDEVSGGGKSMFMLSVIGTAVYAINEEIKYNKDKINKIVTREEVEYILERDKIINQIKTGKYNIYDESSIQNLLKYKINAVSDILKYLDNNFSEFESLSDVLFEYFQNLSFEKINEYFFDETKYPIRIKTVRKFIRILDQIKWYDFEVILHLIESQSAYENLYALLLLKLNKSVYEIEDIEKFKLINNKLENIKNKFPVKKIVKSTLGGKKEKWVCLNCETINSVVPHVDESLAKCSKCHSSIYGTTLNDYKPEQLQKIILSEIKVLKDCFNDESIKDLRSHERL